ncbi:selenocysteine lyase [Acidovorax sp. CF316]|uniref:aminotransferase class V-fold PLP-dependent enzyme n=1 Tax=Acidovorax sp. CF316 TaxID=1144317 RepID=UPI00026BCBB6|nr:aminotransferase class V-fold PLP-dependent enzyme [Acidovorax sp. CF316]EJE50739.1 selenocysteine lyase [Acidovorax sp. CF316]
MLTQYTLSPSETHRLAASRHRFPGALTQTYFDVASRGLVPDNAPDRAHAHLQQRVQGTADKNAYFGLVERARAGFAQLIGAATDEIAITKNVSDGLNMVAASIAWHAGDEVFLCSGVEHPNNIYAWRNLEGLQVSIRDFASADGLFPTDAVIDALQGSHRARVVTLSATSFKPGFRADLDRLGAACRSAGVHLVVDGAQSIGVTHLDLTRTPIDAFAASAQKGLCSLYGMGFLYVRREFAETLTPRYLAQFGVELEANHEADYDDAPIRYQGAAQRFNLGNYNFLASLLVGDTLELLNGVGTQAIDAHVTRLASALSDGLVNLGAPVARAPEALRANMVCIESHNPDAAARLQAHLQAHKVQAAVRRSALRFSLHLYNNQADVDTALAACKGWLDLHGKTLR